MKYIPTQSYCKLLQFRTGAIAALNTQKIRLISAREL